MWTLTQKFRLEYVARSLGKNREREKERERRVGKLLNCCLSLGRGGEEQAANLASTESPARSRSRALGHTFKLQLQCLHGRKKAFLFARTAKKNWLVLPGEKEIRIEPMKVSRALVTLSCLAVAVAVAVEECFYLDFSLVSRRRCGNVYLHLCHSLDAAPCPVPHHSPPPLPLAVFCSSSECVELARGKAYIYMNKVE